MSRYFKNIMSFVAKNYSYQLNSTFYIYQQADYFSIFLYMTFVNCRLPRRPYL